MFLLIMFRFMISIDEVQSSNRLSSTGSISYWPRVDITIDCDRMMAINNLSLGFMLGSQWKSWRDSLIHRALALDANFKLVRLFSHHIEPCTYWNESTKTGTFNWTDVDALIERIFEFGGEPLITIGFYSWTEDCMLNPIGMAEDSVTGLPYPDSFFRYAAEWVKHFKATGWPIRYYEIVNEPYHYFGWNPSDTTKLANYVELWNAAARSMRQENSKILISHDSIMQKRVLAYWLQHGDEVDYLDFHKYDSGVVGKFSDAEMFGRAETLFFETGTTVYGVEEARQIWLNACGKLLPVINSESNFNYAYEQGTDPKIQQMAGAVWTALMLRTAILKGLIFNVYNSFFSSASWELQAKPSGGVGFGMINSDNNQPWYPYYVQKIFGSNIGITDTLFEVKSSSSDISLLGWNHQGTLNVLIISKVDEPRTLHLIGLEDKMNFSKIDNSISWKTPHIQEGQVDLRKPVVINGYTVMLLQSS